MKNALKVFCAALLVAAVSCQEQPQPEELVGKVSQAVPHTVTIHASLEGTKTLIEEDGAGHFSAKWEEGDRIYIKEFVKGVSSDPSLSDLEGQSNYFVTSDGLAAGGKTATFTATFDPYYWETALDPAELATYTFTYKYLACSYNPWYLKTESGEIGLPVYLNPDMRVYAGGFPTADDLLVSQFSQDYVGKPSEIAFNFARLETLVQVTLEGLTEGDSITSGSWFTGSMLSGVNMEDICTYFPETGKWSFRSPGDIENTGMLQECLQVNFTCMDSSRPVVADASGKAVLYLRTLPGEISDWFGIICEVKREGDRYPYSKLVSLEDLGRTLQFKSGGLTKFTVGLLPGTVETPSAINYIVPKPRTGFMAAWPADPHAAGYQCYYTDYDGNGRTTLTPVKGTGEMDGLYTVEADGLAPGVYHLYVRAIPETGYGLASFDYTQKDIYVNRTIEFTWPDISYDSSLITDLGDGLLRVTDKNNPLAPWYFYTTNLTTNWGWLYNKNSGVWSVSTSTVPSMQHDGEIKSVLIQLSKSKENTATVYGVTPAGGQVEIPQPEARYWSESNNYYEYDLSGGSYTGFKIASGGELYVYMLRVLYYPPTGE